MKSGPEWYYDHDLLLEELRRGSRTGGGPEPTEAKVARSMSDSLPKRIGKFQISKVIASGGMGTVYEATQEHPRRTVAIKIMKQGIVSRSALRRFEFESQLLGQLSHPGVAQIFEAGTHDDGSGPVPYFVMEYIPNALPITEYAKQKKLSARARLQLFSRVCDAVHHGHQKGIIHRDLKPGNILVDSNRDPKIIDFGVARGTDSDVALTTIQTDIGQLIGTLQYMSPEQCAGESRDIDIRSDVYALGVVLYELLCDRLPYTVTRLAMHEATRIIREQSPTRLSAVDRTLRGDVETIAHKALEKDRDRRYQSAIELAQDIRRYLSGEAIIARPSSITYQISVLARRNRAASVAVMTLLLVLLAGIIVSSLQALRATRAERRAEANLVEANRQAGVAQVVSKFLQDMLAAPDPYSESQPGRVARDVKVVDVLSTASERIVTAFSNQPEVEAAVRATLGLSYLHLGLFGRAERHLLRALELRRQTLGEEHLDTLQSTADLAELRRDESKYPEAAQLYRRVLEGRRRSLGDDHADTAAALANLAMALSRSGRYSEADPLFIEALETQRRVLGDDHPDTLKTLSIWASHLYLQSNLEEAEQAARQALDGYRRLFGDERAETLSATALFAEVLRMRGRLSESEQLYRQAVDGHVRVFGEEYSDTLIMMSNLGALLRDRGKLSEAESLVRRALEGHLRAYGEEHLNTLSMMNILGSICLARGKPSEAEEVCRQAVEIERRVLGDDHLYTLVGMANLAQALRDQGELSRAESLFIEVVERCTRAQPPRTWYAGVFRTEYGKCLVLMSRFAEAETQLVESYEILKATLGEGERRTVKAAKYLVDLYTAWGKPQQTAQWQAVLATTETTE